MNIIHPTTSRKARTIEDALVLLNKARSQYQEAHDACSIARSIETTAINALNEAQRDFDAAVADVRANPPWNTDWHQKTKSGEAA